MTEVTVTAPSPVPATATAEAAPIQAAPVSSKGNSEVIDHGLDMGALSLLKKYGTDEEIGKAFGKTGEKPVAKAETEETAEESTETEEVVDDSAESDEKTEETAEETEESESDDDFLELERNGEKTKVSRADAKKLAQMGLDYTQKTQALAEEKRSFQAEFEKTKKFIDDASEKYNEKFQELREVRESKDKWDFVLESIKANDSGLYNAIAQKYGEVIRQYSNPIVDRRIEQLEAKISELESTGKEKVQQASEGQFVSAVNGFAAKIGPSVSKLGLEVSWEQVAQVAGGNSANIESAFYMIYGSKISSLYESKVKLEKVQKKIKVIPKTTGVGNMRPAKSAGNSVAELMKGRSLNEIANSINSGRIVI
jgi:hypothetical protein